MLSFFVYEEKVVCKVVLKKLLENDLYMVTRTRKDVPSDVHGTM